MTKLFYQGHGSFRITADDGRVIFVDPAFGGGYELPADIILVTHGHGDHNKIELCVQKENCRIITHKQAVVGGKHKSFKVGGIAIKAVEAGNKNHNPKECVGYVITLDNVSIYASGDTSRTDAMFDLSATEIDYALFCGDGFYNMGLQEAAECAEIVGARNNILIHTVPDAVVLFDHIKAGAWTAPNKLIIEPGQEIELEVDLLKIQRQNRRLKKQIKRLEEESLINVRRIKVLHSVFKSSDKTAIRSEIMSLADDFTVLQEEAEAREVARKKASEVSKESVNAVLQAFNGNFSSEIVVAGEGIEGLETIWYQNDDGTRTYLSMSPKLAIMLSRINRSDYNQDLRNLSHSDRNLSAILNDRSDKGTAKNEISFVGDIGNPLYSLIREEQARLLELARQKRTLELAEIKDRLAAELPSVQAAYYYYSQYEKMKDTEIAAFFSVTKQAVGKVLEKARRNAMTRFLNKLQASPELEKWYEEERAKIKVYT